MVSPLSVHEFLQLEEEDDLNEIAKANLKVVFVLDK